MTGYGAIAMPPSDPALSRKASIVGIGETDYAADYQAERKRGPDWEPRTAEGMISIAFDRALADSGLSRDDIDGVTASFTDSVSTTRAPGRSAPAQAVRAARATCSGSAKNTRSAERIASRTAAGGRPAAPSTDSIPGTGEHRASTETTGPHGSSSRPNNPPT